MLSVVTLVADKGIMVNSQAKGEKNHTNPWQGGVGEGNGVRDACAGAGTWTGIGFC